MDKKFIVAIALSLGTVWLGQWYFGQGERFTDQHSRGITRMVGGVVPVGQSADVVPGQPIKVPTSQDLYKPLAFDVEFADKKITEKEITVSVETMYCKATLSTYGAILSSLDFKEHVGKSGAPLRTVYNKGAYDEAERKKGCFLVALDQKTPYVYSVGSRNESDKAIEVSFSAQTDQWLINKTYVFHKDSYKIDLILGFESQSAQAGTITPRLFFVSPVIGEIADDAVSVFSWNESKQSLEVTEAAQAQGLAWFWTGTNPVFGAQDRYFVHALMDDPAKFAQRGYIKEFDTKTIVPVLEGAPLTAGQKQSYTMSFYMGPKLPDHLAATDDRLEELLSFGWLSWLCKMLLKLLSLIHDYVGNFGFAIIIMTILLKLPFLPMSIYAKKQMAVFQHYAPSINKIRTKYRHDLKLQHEEIMRFYKDHNIAPSTQILGCLPLLIQMPILFALYRVLYSYLDLYQAPFLGWVVDLSAKDPFYVLPVLMGLSMLWQQSVTPVGDEKQRGIMFFMALFMTVVFANFPAGLVLYWLMNNLLTIGEDYLRKYFFK